LLKAFIDILLCQNDQSNKISWVITATFGGAIRDILCDEIPLIFRKEIYATACEAGAVAYLGFEAIGFSLVLKTGLSCAIIIVIRTVAVIKNYSIPVLNEKSDGTMLM
jgi:uncharacterized membrane protein YeiH